MSEVIKERKKLVRKRKALKKRIPKFIRQEARRFKKLQRTGRRRPKGKDSKMRLEKQGRPRLVKVGYGTLAKARHLHPSGYEEVLVYRPEDLLSLDPTIHAVRIASTVGIRKRIEIYELANKIGLKVLNLGRARVRIPEITAAPEVPVPPAPEIEEIGEELAKEIGEESEGSEEEEKKERVLVFS